MLGQRPSKIFTPKRRKWARAEPLACFSFGYGSFNKYLSDPTSNTGCSAGEANTPTPPLKTYQERTEDGPKVPASHTGKGEVSLKLLIKNQERQRAEAQKTTAKEGLVQRKAGPTGRPSQPSHARGLAAMSPAA